jgi:hypothetical protein
MSHNSVTNTAAIRNRRGAWVLGVVVCVLAALGSHGETPDEKKATVAAPEPGEAKKVPVELDALNLASRKMYADARKQLLSTIPVVIIVSGDDLILRKNDTRTAVTVIPAEYHILKCVAHTTLALFTHLSSKTDKPLGEELLKSLTDYQELMKAAVPATEKCGFDQETLARQKRILARSQEFTARVLKDAMVSSDDLVKFCRAARPDLLANGAAAAKAQLQAVHKQVMAWKKDMTAEEWAALTVIVSGAQTPRVENAAVQYFARLFGESNGEGRRIVYAESLWDEDKALNLLGTLRLDGKLAVSVFADPNRMYRDFLADGARTAIDDILGAP